MHCYSVNSLIGEGSFGRVYKAFRKDDNKVVAIKIISKRGRTTKELKNLTRECDIQAKLKHPNVIEMFESFETNHDLIVVTEFALTDLHRFLARNGSLIEERAQKLTCHLVSALYYLHSNRILHRDLKPQNVLLNEVLHAKLCDFGLARNMTMGTHVLTSIKGTPLYMAPELLAERPYDYQADLWSLGCISFETMAGQPPFCTTSILHLVKLIKHEDVKWPSFLTSECRSFLQGLLEKDPTLRFTWAQILCNPFVEGKLLINGIKADNSPFINPKKITTSKQSIKDSYKSDTLNENLAEMKLVNVSSNMTTDNLTSSCDSINAIPPSDIENLETDAEDNINPLVVPFANNSFTDNIAQKNFDKTQMLNMVTAMATVGIPTAIPAVNSQTCFVSGNSNMILNHLNDNFPIVAGNTSQTNNDNGTEQSTKSNSQLNVNLKKTRSKDLEKRKLSQNLDNFSLRLGHSIDTETQRKTTEMLTHKKEQKSSQSVLKTPTQSADEKHITENSPPCLLPGWDSCDESQSPPIENDEWLAFLNRSMQEVLDGELDSLKQHNLVSIIVAPLRNSKAIPKVIECVAQLLSLPFAIGEPASVLETIKAVYTDVKLVPNLMYASKLLVSHKSINDSTASSCTTRPVKAVSELSIEELRTVSRIYELVCHLVHLKLQFVSQFCDSVVILAADELFINFLNHDFKQPNAVRVSNCILSLFCCVLRELPENADLVERVIFNSKVNLLSLLNNKSDLLRLRMCMLFRLLVRFSLRGLQNIWSIDIKRAIENLAEDKNSEVKNEAESTLEELRQFSFY
ncbi:serine/threonine-protein kinase fused [Teleopsis dalmanni]|uniref:serine/threonine-protein kinase fused n=1 Tax=Teleopsis dalmanni TaxID=139649 RepID=UPI0018CD92E9|nr:serine/threonine-protein kinase fused [Teleopsis dalmanni]